MTTEELAKLIAKPTEGAIEWKVSIDKLRAGRKPIDIKSFKDQYEVEGHEVMNNIKRQDKRVVRTNLKGEDYEEYEKVNRVGLAMQELITTRAVSFLFGKPPQLSAKPVGPKQLSMFEALLKIMKAVKVNGHNKEVALDLFRCTEVAERWFPVETGPQTKYGIESKFKLRVMRFSPWNGDTLYPLFDDTGDMIAFSREYTGKDSEGRDIIYFETYTDNLITIWTKSDGTNWLMAEQSENAIGKIPVVYARQEKPEWAKVQNLIERLETLLSNYADTNDYHGSPTILVKGEIKGWSKKGEAGKILELKNGAEASYLSWQQAVDMVKLEIDTKFRLIYSLSQTPDISFDAMKSLGDVSGIALKLLFMDAYLKVEDKKLIFEPFLERRMSIVKSFIETFNVDLKGTSDELSVDTLIQPYEIDNMQAIVDLLMAANNGQPLISQKTAVAKSGLTDDPEAEYELVQKESKERQQVNITEPSTI